MAAALALRFYHLDSIPIAGDESIYLRWAEIVANQKQWFISLLDGKQPLSYWLYAVVRLLWPSDPLWGARLISVLAGGIATLGIYGAGKRLAGKAAGLGAATLYAFLPYALLYDRLAYAESLVNLAGVLVVYAWIRCFEARRGAWKPALWMGLALGLGYFTKSTMALFAVFPLLAAPLWQGPRRWLRLAAAYGVAIVFPVLSWTAVPQAPVTQPHSLVLHQTDFFVAPQDWIRNPLVVAPANLRLLGEYLGSYVTWPFCAAALAATAWLLYQRSPAVWIVALTSWLPLLTEVFALKKVFPSRYPFPHIWPWCLLVAAAATAVWSRYPALRAGRLKVLAGLLLAAAVLPMLARGVCVVRAPQECLHREDAQAFLGSGPAAGHGIQEAVDFLLGEAHRGPLAVLTDPIWGPPADAMFAYLNHRNGIRVYEAWWTTISENYPLLPPSPVELVKSQYERVPAGFLDPAKLERVYYVTERHYVSPEAVLRRQPNARRVAAFVKPNRRNAIDIYRLK